MIDPIAPDPNFVHFKPSNINDKLPTANQELGPLEAKPKKVDHATLQKELSILKMQSQTTPDNKSAIENFLRVKTDGTLQEQANLISNINLVQELGKETWLIGLIGMSHGAHGMNTALIEAIILQLGRYLTDDNAWFIVSILRAIDHKSEDGVVTDKAKQHILQRILSADFVQRLNAEGLDDFTRQQIINIVTDLLTHMDEVPALTEFLSLVGLTKNAELIDKGLIKGNESVLDNYRATLFASLMASTLFDNAVYSSVLSSSLGMIYALINIVDLEAYVYRGLVKHKYSQVAILTDHPLHDAFQQFEHIHVVERDPVHPIKSFHTKYRQLLDQKYGLVYVFVADSHYWTSYHYATAAADKMQKMVKIINTKTFGLGIGVLIQEASRLLYKEHVDLDEFELRVNRLINTLRYWVAPSSCKDINERYWFKNMLKHRQGKKRLSLTSIPLLEFHHPIGILGSGKTYDSSLSELELRINASAKQMPYPPKRLIIVYKTIHPEALRLANHICSILPGIEMTVIPCGKFLASQFGDHVGVVLI